MRTWLKNLLKKQQPKIFCISFQRTGTTSVGQFFKDHGFEVAGYDKERSTHWSVCRFTGNYEAIFKSKGFKENQVFEDNPWFENDFYKYLYHRFPNSKFVLFTRDSNKWFDSMVKHSNGKTLGNTFRHSKLYLRTEEYYSKFSNINHYKTLYKIDNLLDLNETNRDHYIKIYETRNKEVLDFFSEYSPNSLFTSKLEDDNKWVKLGEFCDIKVSNTYISHENKSLV